MGLDLDGRRRGNAGQHPREPDRRRRRRAAPPQGRGARRAAGDRQHGVPPRRARRPPLRRRRARLPQGQGRGAAADGEVPDGQGQDDRRAAGDRPAQSVRAPPRAPDGGRGSDVVVREHRRRVSQDRRDFAEENRRRRPCGRRGPVFVHRRHHRRDCDAAGPRRHRRRAPVRAGRRARSRRRSAAGARRSSRGTPPSARSDRPGGDDAPRDRSGRRRPGSPRRIPTPAKTSSKSAGTAARCCCSASSSWRWRTARGWPSPASSRCARTSTAGSIWSQAEAVADLVDAVTPLQARAAMDQLEGTLTRRDRAHRCGALRSVGAARSVARLSRRRISLRHARADAAASWRGFAATLRAARRRRPGRPRDSRRPHWSSIVGRPNAGKSSLFNALSAPRAPS